MFSFHSLLMFRSISVSLKNNLKRSFSEVSPIAENSPTKLAAMAMLALVGHSLRLLLALVGHSLSTTGACRPFTASTAGACRPFTASTAGACRPFTVYYWRL